MHPSHPHHLLFTHLTLRTLLTFLVALSFSTSTITHAIETRHEASTASNEDNGGGHNRRMVRSLSNPQPDQRVLAFESAYNSFIACILTESSICETCSKKMGTFQETFHALTKTTFPESPVHEPKIDKTVIAIAKSLFQNAADLFTYTGQCRKCEENEDYFLFHKTYWALEECLDNAGSKSCSLCLQNYTELNDIYMRLVSEDSLCLGINERMEQMTDDWSNLGCPLTLNYNLLAISLAFAFVMMVPLLYILAKVWHQPVAPADGTHGCLAGVHESTEKSSLLHSQSVSCQTHR